LLVEAIKELSSGVTQSNNTYLETQTILAEDNNIDLNYSGTPETALGGGLRVLHAKGQDISADLITDSNGDFTTNNDFKPNSLTIPTYTPSSSSDINGNIGNITRDEDYIYVKTSSGWKRSNLESF
jgi:catalase (peroxidase I)